MRLVLSFINVVSVHTPSFLPVKTRDLLLHEVSLVHFPPSLPTRRNYYRILVFVIVIVKLLIIAK